MTKCMKCGREITGNEIGLHKKMINRGAVQYMCLDCLAAHFNCPSQLLADKIAYFRSMGCMLFTPEPDEFEKKNRSAL